MIFFLCGECFLLRILSCFTMDENKSGPVGVRVTAACLLEELHGPGLTCRSGLKSSHRVEGSRFVFFFLCEDDCHHICIYCILLMSSAFLFSFSLRPSRRSHDKLGLRKPIFSPSTGFIF